MLSILTFTLTLLPLSVLGQFGPDPAVKKYLTEKRFNYTNLPYKVDTDQGTQRGPQYGYNLCNSTTEGPNSLCQNAMVNSLDDFCIWGPFKPNSVIGDIEGEAIAWCTKPGRGTRLIPQNALTGVQFMKTSAYVQVVGFINQALVDIKTSDDGGELDPHGYDGRGNPLGGLVFSNAFPSNKGNNDTYQQVIEWHNFMGAGEFCIKACDATNKNAAKFCEHIYDRVGCEYNAPNNAKRGTFESCQGDTQDYPGQYVQNGVTMTWRQPEGDIGAIPYVARVPKSSSCVQFKSEELYATATSSASSSAATPTGSGMVTATGLSSRTTLASATPSATGATGSTGDAQSMNLPVGMVLGGLALTLSLIM